MTLQLTCVLYLSPNSNSIAHVELTTTTLESHQKTSFRKLSSSFIIIIASIKRNEKCQLRNSVLDVSLHRYRNIITYWIWYVPAYFYYHLLDYLFIYLLDVA